MTALPVFESALLGQVPGIRHGFFTRQGGVSMGLYESLNVGRGSDDDPSSVTSNRGRIQASLAAASLKTVYQVHSATVVPACQADAKADGLVTKCAGEAVAILTADCVPVLMATSDGSAVAGVHAGWKGAVSGILDAAVKQLGTTDIVAAIGPAIAQQSYEVGEDVFNAASAPSYFVPNGSPGKYQFDLTGFVSGALEATGITAIDVLSEDTYSQPDLFFSYRRSCHRSEPDYGRQMSAILRIA
ncbi:MAG: peptidoglycan editing factor PgeF [Sphingomonadales bacterium]